MIAFPPFRLDLDEGRLWKGETLLTLRRKPMAILRYLAQHPQKLVSQEELLAEVWAGAVVSDSAVRSHLHELRQVLGEGVVETVIGQGYRFVARIAAPAHTAEPTRAASTAQTGPGLVGREAELAALRGALGAARAGQRRVCFVTGDPGIGKSTLVRTFLAALEADVGAGALAIGQGACFEQHVAPEPFVAVIEALASLRRAPGGDAVLGALIRHAPTFVAQLPSWMSEAQLSEVSRRATGGSEARQLRELCEALEALAAVRPLVLVFEDLQWSDVATIDLLSMLAQRTSPARLLVLGTSRKAELQSPQHPLSRALRTLVGRAGATELILTPLGRELVQTLLDRRFPGHELPRAFTERVREITGGTPLFLAALLDELAGRGLVAPRPGDGRWALAVPMEAVEAHRPASIKQLIDLQLDRLSALEQRVLEAAAVVGAEFATRWVAAALESSTEEVDDVCDGLARRAQFLAAAPDGRYGVTHALIQEVCIERSSPARRQRWHRRIAEALSREAGVEHANVLAQHFDAAGEVAEAVRAYAEAGCQAGLRFATSDAVAACARALQLIPRMPPGRPRDLLELQVLRTMCRQVSSNSFSAAFAGREAHAVYGRAIELARALADPNALYVALMQLCQYDMIVAQYHQASALFAELEQLERDHAIEPSSLRLGIFTRGYVAFFRADFAAAQRCFARLLPARAQAASDDPAPSTADDRVGHALAFAHIACVHWVVGEEALALEEARETIALAERAESAIMQALGHVVRARLRFLRRDPPEVVEAEAPLAVRASAVDVALHNEACAVALWAEARRAPRPLSAIEPLLAGLEQRLREVSTCSTLVALMLIEVLRLSGYAERALALTEEIIEFARSHDEAVYLPELLRVRGEQRQASAPEEAARDYLEALELARATGARSLERRAAESWAALAGGASAPPVARPAAPGAR